VPLTRNIHHLKSKRPAVSQPAQVSTLFPVRLPSLRPPCIRSPLRRVRLPATVRQVTLIYYQEISKHSYHDTDISCPGIHKPSGTHKLILNIWHGLQTRGSAPRLIQALGQVRYYHQAASFYRILQHQDPWSIVSYTSRHINTAKSLRSNKHAPAEACATKDCLPNNYHL
jgi:hypothetical protein